MEYIILNKHQKIPTLGFNFNPSKNFELTYFKNYSILSTNNLFIYLDFKNKFYNLKSKNNNNFYVAPLIKNLLQLKNLNINLQFIIIEQFDSNIIEYCNQNNINPILFFNNKFISDKKNVFLKNFKFLQNEIIIKFLIEKGIIVISDNDILDFKFDYFLGDLELLFN